MATITMTIEEMSQIIGSIGKLRGKNLAEQVQNIERVIRSDSATPQNIIKLFEKNEKKTRKSKKSKEVKPEISDDSEFDSEIEQKVDPQVDPDIESKEDSEVEQEVKDDVKDDVKPKRTRAPKEQVDMEAIENLDDNNWKYLTCDEGKSNKFWRATTVGAKLFVNYGKVGCKGTYNQKTFESEDDAKKQLSKDIVQKEKKGYH